MNCLFYQVYLLSIAEKKTKHQWQYRGYKVCVIKNTINYRRRALKCNIKFVGRTTTKMASPTLDMDEVIDNLYIGSKSAVKNADTLKAKGITHIVTVSDHPLPLVVSQEFKYKYIHGLDLEFTDLLTMFDECYQFIDEGRLQGSVIVHW